MQRRRSFVGSITGLVLVALIAAAAPAQDQRRELPRAFVDVFSEVMKKAARSTVEIYSDGSRAALGAIISSDGQIATKASEIVNLNGDPWGKTEVQLSFEKRRREARVVARDTKTDLAILKIDAKDLPVAPWSSSEAPAVGSWLVTPGMSTFPLSVGVVSVAARKLPPNGALGIGLENNERYARITEIRPGLAAESAGLKMGDIIRKFDGEDIKASEQLRKTIRWHYPGEKIKIVYEREGRLHTTEAELSSMTDLGRDERSEFQNSLGGKLSERRTGFPMAIQHDSVLRPIDCGGPVVDLDGKVIGLNIARAGRVESYALPAGLVQETIARLLKTELVSAPADEKIAPRKSSTPQER
jgi:serine protease Do